MSENKGKSRARRWIDTTATENKDNMVRDAKTGKEMPYRQFMELRAKQELEDAIKNTVFNKPICPVYQNVSAEAVSDETKIKDE